MQYVRGNAAILKSSYVPSRGYDDLYPFVNEADSSTEILERFLKHLLHSERIIVFKTAVIKPFFFLNISDFL